jgi:threonine/homoserine/homoserine lactone efflux protein
MVGLTDGLVSGGASRYVSRIMQNALFIAAVVACFSVLVVLMIGIFSFARGGEFNRKYANKIMRLRIITQAIAVVLILAAVLVAQSGN